MLIGAGILWWTSVYNRPSAEQLFWGMLNQSLKTQSVTIESDQQKDNGVLMHTVLRYQLGGTNRAQSLVTYTQGATEVRDESLSTPTADYVQYVSIKTDSTGKDGKPLDFSRVLHVWAKQDGEAQGFSQALFDNIVLHADLTPGQRNQLLNQMRTENVYELVGKPTKRTNAQTGRLEYVYNVKVQGIPYMHLVKVFAQQVGMHTYDNMDPNLYSGQRSFTATLVVDVRSRHLVSVEDNGQAVQSYSGFGIPVTVPIPSHPIPQTELQKRFGSLE